MKTEERNHVYALESIRGDMYVKYIEYSTKNPKADLKPLQDKLQAMQDASDCIMRLIEKVDKLEYELKKKEIVINKLFVSGL